MELIIAGVSVRYQAQSAHKAGHTIKALDYFGDREINEIAKWEYLEEITQLTTDDYDVKNKGIIFSTCIENFPEVYEKLKLKGAIVYSPDTKSLENCRNTKNLDEICKKHNIFRPINIATTKETEKYPNTSFLIKPQKSGTGIGITEWDGKQELNEEEYLQEKIEGISFSAIFIADGNNATLMGVSRQLAGEKFLGATGYDWCGNIMPFDNVTKNPQLLNEIRRITKTLTKEFNLIGACGIDYMLNDDKIYLLEINPRITASFELLEEIMGINAVEAHIDAFKGILPNEPKELTEALPQGKGIVYVVREGLIAPNTDNWKTKGRHDIPYIGTEQEMGYPLCTVITPPLADQNKVIEYLTKEANKIWDECTPQ